MTQAMRNYRVPLAATTIHRMLSVIFGGGGEGWHFRFNAENPLPYQFLIIDEWSMGDNALTAHVLDARGRGTHIIFIGDIEQLSPVGAGAPLRDMILAGVPRGDLTEIRRNAGTIVKVCAAIRDRRPVVLDRAPNPDANPPRNLQLIECANNEDAANKIVAFIRWIRDNRLILTETIDGRVEQRICDPVWDVQVLCAKNDGTPLARKPLNRRLQEELNPHGRTIKDSPFRAGDKVVCLKNSIFQAMPASGPALPPGAKTLSPGQYWIANGEQGRVEDVQEKLTVINFFHPDRLVKVPRGKPKTDAKGDKEHKGDQDAETGAGCDVDLAYVVTVHKFQGSETPVALIGLDDSPGARMVTSRNHFYTAISRPKFFGALFGTQATIDSACRRDGLRRTTALVERIAEARKSIEAGRLTVDVACISPLTETEDDILLDKGESVEVYARPNDNIPF